MRILAIESTAGGASAAVTEDGKLVAQYFLNSGLTHSRTLMPMVRDMLATCGRTLEEMDAVAVAAGPGSFTGLRIGVATAKGLGWAAERPCFPVSTLEAMAEGVAHMDGLILAAMDARRGQIYNAVFRAEEGKLTRLCPDRAVEARKLAEEMKNEGNRKIIVGDGALLCYNLLLENEVAALRLAPPHLRMQSAWGVAAAAERRMAAGEAPVSAQELAPVYLRLSQAERERLEKNK